MGILNYTQKAKKKEIRMRKCKTYFNDLHICFISILKKYMYF